MNITLSVDERVADEARKAAGAMGMSLNQAVRDDLEQLARTHHLQAPLKRQAIHLIKTHRAAGTAVLSTQVLQEYVNVALRKLHLPVPLIQERLSL